jgi:hypothetical protein
MVIFCSGMRGRVVGARMRYACRVMGRGVGSPRRLKLLGTRHCVSEIDGSELGGLNVTYVVVYVDKVSIYFEVVSVVLA